MDMKIVMPDEKDSRTVAQIVKEYAPFVQRFIDERSVNQAAQMFAAGCSNMDYWSCMLLFFCYKVLLTVFNRRSSHSSTSCCFCAHSLL